MAYYKKAYLRIPINCKWECIHCAHKNSGRGRLTVGGDTVRYSPGIFNHSEREHNATIRSLQGINPKIRPACEMLLATVNIRKRHHSALASVRPFCAKCGKRQPWQTRAWSAYLLYAMGGVIVFLIGLMIVKRDLWEIDPESFTYLILGSAIFFFVLSMLAPSIQDVWVNHKMSKDNNKSCFPIVYFDSPPPSSSTQSGS